MGLKTKRNLSILEGTTQDI